MDIKSINVFKRGVNKCLGDLESAILEALWSCDEPMTAREVTAVLQKKNAISFNAISTVLKRLEKKGLVSRLAKGKRYRFVPAMSKEEYSRSIVVSGIQSLLSDKQLLSAAGLSASHSGETIDDKTLKLLKDFVKYAESNTSK